MERGNCSFPSTTTYSTAVHRWLVLCAVHIIESPNRSLLKSKGKEKEGEAGCYHNSQLICAARDVGECVGVSLQRYDFSEPQSGKDVCDRILCPFERCHKEIQ